MSTENAKPQAAKTVEVSVGGKPTRREAMQWVLAAMAASTMTTAGVSADETPKQSAKEGAGVTAKRPVDRLGPRQELALEVTPVPVEGGYGMDADLRKNYAPGDLWPLTFNETQKKTAKALADTIIPEDKLGPAASDVGVVEMVDEWISSPYAQTQADQPVVIEGLAWIEGEAKKRFGKGFAEIEDEQREKICDDICWSKKAKAEFKTAAHFFSRFRSLCAGAYYATPEGWKAIGYVGNVQLPAFNGPPKEVLAKLGVEQTVK